MVAHAYAVRYPEYTASICWGECPILGSTFYQQRKGSTQFWHFVFHSIPDLPELLIAGKVREYQKHFFDRHGQNAGAFTPEDLEVYGIAYSASGGMRCALNVYRAFERDALHNNNWLKEKGKCDVRCLTLWGDSSWAGEADAIKMCKEYYSNVEYAKIKDCGHWIGGGAAHAVCRHHTEMGHWKLVHKVGCFERYLTSFYDHESTANF